MLLLHETHQVRGLREREFEERFRDAWVPRLADAGACLLAYLRHAHGTGASYRVVTLTALEGAGDYARLAREVDAGCLREPGEELDALRHDVVGKALVPLPWSPVRSVDLARVGVRSEPCRAPAVFMEDTVWPEAGKLERYVQAAGSHYAKEMAERERERRAILRIEAAFRTAFGAGRRREVVLWQRVVNLAALGPLVSREVPERYTRPGTWMHDALGLRDQWESRLLRSADWSPF